MSRQTLHSLVAVLFVVSGVLGLMYQVVWFKYLSLFLGNTTYAQAIVLASFMGGLAIGAYRWGRMSDRIERPLALYGWLEFGIGVYCLLYPTLLKLFEGLFVAVVVGADLPGDSTAVLGLKLLLSLITLLPPTIMMGGTLPVLVKYISDRLEHVGKTIATLYFLNSFGAVVGALLAGFFFIRLVGLPVTVYSAAVVNLFVGFAALLLSRRTVREPAGSIEPESEQPPVSPRTLLLALSAAGVSGVAAMVYEVSWVRLLIPVVGSSTYSFSLMLVCFISGIALGSLIVSSFIDRITNFTRWVWMCQGGIVLSMALTLPLYGRIPYIYWNLGHVLARNESAYPWFLVIQGALLVGIMIVPTVFLGMTLPIASRMAASNIRLLGTTVGNVYSVNTVGNVVGSLLAGLVLIPLVGVRHAIEIAVVLNLSVAVAAAWLDDVLLTSQKVMVGGALALSVLAYGFTGTDWNRNVMLSGVFRLIAENSPPPKSYAEFNDNTRRIKVHFYSEGHSASVAVIDGSSRTGVEKVLLVNGKADASSMGDLPTQVMLAQLPMLLHPDPKDVLVIGLGSGITAGSVLTHPVDRLDCVEISPEVVEASRLFDDVSGRPLEDPRTHLTVDDALSYMKLTNRSFDVIISEPSNPWIAGIGNLYTREFFRTCKTRLGPRGIMVQWFHLYEMNDDILQLVLRTYRALFPFVSLWQSLSGDVILVGANQPISRDFERLRDRMKMPAVHQDLARIDIDGPAAFLSQQMLSDESVRRYAGVGPLNTEHHPLLEYLAPEAFFVNKGVRELLRRDDRMDFGQNGLILKSVMEERPLTLDELKEIGKLHALLRRGNNYLGYSVLREVTRRDPKDISAFRLLAEVAGRIHRPEEALAALKRLAELEPRNPDALERYAWMRFIHEGPSASALAPLNTDEIEQAFRKCIAMSADTVDRYRTRLADMYFGTRRYEKAVDQYARALQIRERYEPDPGIPHDRLLAQLATCLHYLGKNDRAVGYALQAIQYNTANQQARDLIYDIWTGSETSPQDTTDGPNGDTNGKGEP